MGWDGWPFVRIATIFVALAFLVIGFQVTLFHYRQNFHHRSMWLPVISAPLIFLTGLIYSFWLTNWSYYLYLILLWIGLVDGVVGAFFHIRGVRIRVGGWTLRNLLIGPPIFLPMMFGALSILGLLAVWWR
ncbi:hypothetical protein [Rubeoparvulum massiliense]|uniref:hypothetical protein n=1 Tax=Rubeoparvulum massiliense TaxID=1631346 RepID=UPI00065E0CDA|nr:hypothetical protein [Rubeoparvulum massiliense]